MFAELKFNESNMVSVLVVMIPVDRVKNVLLKVD
jgi:hypothetical protein